MIHLKILFKFLELNAQLSGVSGIPPISSKYVSLFMVSENDRKRETFHRASVRSHSRSINLKRIHTEEQFQRYSPSQEQPIHLRPSSQKQPNDLETKQQKPNVRRSRSVACGRLWVNCHDRTRKREKQRILS